MMHQAEGPGHSAPPTEASVQERCLAQKSCLGYWDHNAGAYQIFCSVQEGLCTNAGTPGVTVINLASGQNTNDCWVKRPESHWGASFLVVLCLFAAVYIGGGIFQGTRTGRSGSSAGGVASSLQSHPHWGYWQQLRGLCTDGYRMVAQRGPGAAASAPLLGGDSDAACDEPREQKHKNKGQRSSSSGSKEKVDKADKGQKNPSSKSKSKRSKLKGDAAQHEEDSGGSSQAEGAVAAATTRERQHEQQQEEEEERMLKEQRDESMHSSQQKIRVVGLNG